MRGQRISKGILRIIYCGAVFILALFVLSSFMNRGNTDMTTEMPDATYPLVSFLCDGMQYNQMQGYAQEMDVNKVREHVTPVGDDRRLEFMIDTYGEEIERLSFRVRSLRDGRLIEDTQVFDYARQEDEVRGSLTVKDLLRKGSEYSLCIVLETRSGKKLYYYTQLLRQEGMALSEKLAFAYRFSDLTFDKVSGAVELPTYLESNAQGDNTTFHTVNIHSSATQVLWGNLEVERLTQPRARICELDAETAQIRLDYIVQIPEESRLRSYFIEENFRLRLGKERMYLLDYERGMDQIFTLGGQEKKAGVPDPASVIMNNKIVLGITDSEVQKKESIDGNTLAFVDCGRLFTYDVADNRIAQVFSFFGDDLSDRRETARNSDIRICQVEETGNITFLVYGYMNCGSREGYMGVAVCEYDSMLNTVEEKVFVPYDGSYERLCCDVERLAYAADRTLYLAVGDSLYEIPIEGGTGRAMVKDLPLKGFCASEDESMVVWSNGKDIHDATELTLKNLAGGRQHRITAGENERILPIAFFGQDLVYGLARTENITHDLSDRTVFAMHKICIRSEDGEIQKEYEQPGIYITGVETTEGMITLHRVKENGNGVWEAAADDQILNNSRKASEKNTVETAVTERFETIVQIAARSDIKTDSLKIREPRFVIYEGERTAAIEKTASRNYYYLYQKGRLQGIYENAYEPIMQAYLYSGVVRNGAGEQVYRRMSLPVKNQIMAISAPVTETGRDDIPIAYCAACLDTWLAYEGVNVQTLPQLEDGIAAADILAEQLPEAEVLELYGVEPEAMLYYTAQDIPVMMQFADGGAMLLIGYNELNIVVLNPRGRADGETVYKVGKGDAAKLLAENGNRFLVCLIHRD